MTLRALIFDVDGTLADTEELHRSAFNAAFLQNGLPWFWDRQTYAALLAVAGGRERIAYFIELLGHSAAERARLTQRISAVHAAKTQIYAGLVASGRTALRDGVTALLEEARRAGLRLAIASTTTPSNVTALLVATLGAGALSWFDVIAAGDQAVRKKPAPDIYLLALQQLRLSAERCLAFEDSHNGLAAAKGAGLCTVVAPTYWTAGEDLGAADLLVAEFSRAGGVAGLQSLHSDWLARRAVVA